MLLFLAAPVSGIFWTRNGMSESAMIVLDLALAVLEKLTAVFPVLIEVLRKLIEVLLQ